MLEPINSYLDKTVKKSGIESQVKASQAIDEFHLIIKQIYGPKILKKVQAKSLKNRVLNVYVLSSVLANELRLREREIIENINKKHKTTLVEKLRLFL